MTIRKVFRRLFRYRSIRLTPDGVRFVLLAVGIGVASINTGNNLLYLLFAMMLSLIVISGILSERCFKQLQITRHLPPAIFANQAATAAFIIANRSPRFPIFSVRAMDVVGDEVVERGVHLLQVSPASTTIQSYPLLVPRRGLYRLDGIKLLTRFPFGLFVKSATIPVVAQILVYPEVRALASMLCDDLAILGHEQALAQRGQGTALHNLRLYQPGDDSRSIHWRTTARKSLLIVRETEAEDLRRVAIVLQTFHPESSRMLDAPENFEKAVILAASLAVFFTERGYEIRLVAGEQEITYEAGESHLLRMLALLAMCRPCADTIDCHSPKSVNGNEWTIHVSAWADSEPVETSSDCRVLLATDYV